MTSVGVVGHWRLGVAYSLSLEAISSALMGNRRACSNDDLASNRPCPQNLVRLVTSGTASIFIRALANVTAPFHIKALPDSRGNWKGTWTGLRQLQKFACETEVADR